MSENFPRWNIEPQLQNCEVFPIPQSPDKEWCSMVNYMYAGKSYQVQVRADHYSVAKMSADGNTPTQTYTQRELVDYQGDPDDHYFIGIFVSIEMRPDWRSDTRGIIHKVPFVRMTDTVDLDAVDQLTVPNQHVLVPVSRMQELWLEK